MYKLLIVDDEKMIRQGIKDGIEWEKLGIAEVYTAASAEKAMDIIERIHPQIMLTDISMEKMTGLDLISRIRNSPDDKEMRIIVLSGYSQFDYAKQCLQMQVQNFLLKPVDEEELIRNVSQQLEVLEQNRISRELETKMKRSEGIRRQMALEQFMRELVHQRCQNGKSSSWPEEVLEERNSPVEAVLLIQDACINIDKLADINLLQMTIKNICMELVDFKREGVTFFDDDGRIIIAFFLL